VIYDHWLGSAAAAEAIIVAPTTRPHGFTFEGDDSFKDLQTLYRTLGEAMKNYRVDWNRVFLEVEGRAMRATCEQTFVFAGFIVRDRVDDRRRPFIDPSEFFMFENLNGVPLCYVADRAHWERVGEPIAEALRGAYREAGAPDNLLLLQADRDPDEALRADDEALAAFVRTHRHDPARRSFRWRFFHPLMCAPMPFELDATLDGFDEDAPPELQAGSMHVAVTREKVRDEDGSEQLVNLVAVDVKEAKGFTLRLADGWIDFDLPLTVRVNGETVIDRQPIERDWRYFWDNIVPYRFFMCPYLGSVEVKFDRVPQLVPR
jgi:hypothetical protein